MNTLLAQMFLLLVLAAGTGWFIGDWWQRRIGRAKEEVLEEKLKSSLKRFASRAADATPEPAPVADEQMLAALRERSERLEQLQQANTLELSGKDQEIAGISANLEHAVADLKEQRKALRLAHQEADQWKRSYETAQRHRQELEADYLQVGEEHTQTDLALRQERDSARESLRLLQVDVERQQEEQAQALRAAEVRTANELETVQAEHQRAMDALRSHYDDRVRALQDQLTARDAQHQEHDDALDQLRKHAQAELTSRIELLEEAHAGALAELEAQHKEHLQGIEYDQARERDATAARITELEAALADKEQDLANFQAQLQEQTTTAQSVGDDELANLQARLDAATEESAAAAKAHNQESLNLHQSLRSRSAQLETLRLEAEAKEQQVIDLEQSVRGAELNVSRLKELCDRLRQQSNSASKAAFAERRKVDALQATLDGLQQRASTSEEIAEVMRAEFQKRRTFVADMQRDLKESQRRLVLSQQQVQELKSKNTRLLAERAADRNLAAPVAAIGEGGKPGNDSATVKALRTRLHRQQLRLDFVGDLVRDLQSMVSSDLAQAVQTRRELGLDRREAGAKTPSDNLQLIKGIGWRKEIRLNSLGIRRYKDLARLGEKDALWLDTVLGLDGEVIKQDWIGQSRVLSLSRARRARRARELRQERQRRGAQAAGRRGEAKDSGSGAA